MPPPVHIAIHQEGDITALVHAQYFDSVLVVQRPRIHILRVIKAEEKYQLAVYHIVAVKPVSHHECDHVSSVALRKTDLVPHNSQINLVAAENIASLVKHLVHCPFIVQQIHAVSRIAHPVEFLHTIIGFSSSLPCGNIILQKRAACLGGKLLDGDPRLAFPGNFEISPCHLVKAAVDRHLAQSRVIALGI